MAGVKVFLDKEKVKSKVQDATEYATFTMAQQALKDSNYFARQQTSELINSSLRASDFKKGLLVWNTKYARVMYYVGNPRHDVNPNADKMWAHKARAAHGDEWKKIGQEAVKKYLESKQ